MTATELKEKENDVLQQELVAQTKHLFDLRSQAVTEKLEDPSQLRKTRKEIAQMKTILRQREIEAQPKREKAAPAKAAEKTPTVKKSTVKKSAAKRKTTAATAE
jgi:large subunit ribosomal protein L29